MTKEERNEMARKYFSHVMCFAEESVDDEVYAMIDPDEKYGDELIEEFNLFTIKEVIRLGFKAKYGIELE